MPRRAPASRYDVPFSISCSTCARVVMWPPTWCYPRRPCDQPGSKWVWRRQPRRLQESLMHRPMTNDLHEQWEARTRVVLQPIAAPSILGLFGFAAATFMVSTYLAGWYHTANAPAYLFPFAAMFGGLAQFIAGLWCYRARDGIGTAMHGMWGAF